MQRRSFLQTAVAVGCCAAASPAFSPMAFAAVPSDHRLVVIVLRGAMDGLDVVQPHGDKLLRTLRPTFKIGPDQGAVPLTNFYSMHAALRPLLPLWNAGDLAFAHAVSTPYRDKRSHFDGQDLLEAGTGPRLPLPLNQSGWLNRLIQTFPKVTSETAYNVGADTGIILQGSAPSNVWNPDVAMKLSTTGVQLLRSVCARDTLFLHALDRAVDISGKATGVSTEKQVAVRYAQFVAARLKGQSRIASFSIGAWDTHANQEKNLTTALDGLGAAILALRKDLGALWNKTTVLAVTEFGRTARSNGSEGTDHGTGGAMIMAGGTLSGKKVFGKWPGLDNLYQDRDLLPTMDVRDYAAWAIHKLYGVPKSTLQNAIFPGLTMGPDQRFIA